MKPLTPRQILAFWAKVRKGPGCWEWTAARLRSYGQFRHGELAHRISWLIAHGDPGDQKVLHECDNPLCVRPSHLFLGTQRDNLIDCLKKGRQTRAYSGKVIRLVRVARKMGLTYVELSAVFGMTPSSAHRIVTEERWAA